MLRRTDKKHSEEWLLSAALARKNRRLIILLLASLILWAATIITFVAHRQTAHCFCAAGKVDTMYEENIVP